MIIYKITNIVNNKVYIGQTTQSIKTRISQHFNLNNTYCRQLHYALKKYGKENFSYEILDTASDLINLNNLEEYYIKKYNSVVPNGYNLLAGGFNKKHNEETKLKMSKSRLGKINLKLRRPRGKRPPQVGINISLAKKGRSNGLLGYKRPYVEKPWRNFPILGIGKYDIKMFKSIKTAAKYFTGRHSNIVACLKNKRCSAYGYRWFYLEKD